MTNKTFPQGPYRRNGLTIEVPQMGLRLATVAFSKDAPEKNVGFACPDVETAEAVANLLASAYEQNEALVVGRAAMFMLMDKICTMTGGKYDEYTGQLMAWAQQSHDKMGAAIAKARGGA